MASQKSPFEVLGISRSAEPEVIAAAYKALARKYHPDMNPGMPHAELNRRMAELNWAREELERDLGGWRKRVTAQSAERVSHQKQESHVSSAQAVGPLVQVKPQVLVLPGRRGASTVFAANAEGLPASAIRARFKSVCIDLQRQPPAGDSAMFAVTVTDDFTSDLGDNAIETIEVLASGFLGNKVFVSIAPVSASILRQEYGYRVAPPRHASHKARISFGKHRGRTFQEIALEEPGYLWWMLREQAGSQIERESARLALGLLTGGTLLKRRDRTPSRAGKRLRVPSPSAPLGKPTPPPSPARSLPDPHRLGGMLDAIKGLFRRRQQRS